MSLLIKRSLVEQAVEQLRERIAQGDWQIGQSLPTEPELALQLGISRNTVREAMRVLAFSGLVEVRQGDGSYLRTAQDPLLAMQAMARCTPSRPVKPATFSRRRRLAWPRCGAPMQTCKGCAKRWPAAPGIFMVMSITT